MNSRMLGRLAVPVLGCVLLLTACESESELPTSPGTTPNTELGEAVYRLNASDLSNPDPTTWTLQSEFDLTEFTSESNLAAIGTLTPAVLNDTLAAGETVTEDKTASLPEQADVVDIVFAFDNTGSMGGELDNLKVNAVDIMNSLAALISDVQFGLVSFADYEGFFENTGSSGGCDYVANYGFTGDDPYIVEQVLDANISTVATAIGDLDLSPGGGADLPESYSRALYELAQELLDNTGPDGPVNWRPEARRIVILFGDAFPHSCDLFDPVEPELGVEITGDDLGIDPGRDATIGTADDLAILEVIADLVQTDITLISLHSVQTSIPGLPVEPSLALWSFYAEETGGTNFEINTDGSFPPGTDIVETILELVGEQISTVDELVLDVCPGDEAFADWISAVTPPSYTDIELPADRDFDLVLGPPSGTEPGVYAFDVCAIGDGAVLGSQSVTITVPGETEPAADLSIEKTADPASVLVGEDITWTVTIANAGPDAATNVVFTDELPTGVTLVTDISSICTIDAGVATCEAGDLAAGEDVSIEIVTTADEAGTPVNSVEVSSDVADPNSDNNSSSAEVSVTTPPEPGEPEADLSIEKTADPASVLVGEDITWTVTIANAGPDAATNVVFTDELPTGVTLVTDISSICTIDAGVATCEAGDLAAGEDVSIEIVTTADEAGTPVNSVEVSSDVADPNSDDNSSSAEVSVTTPPEPGECVVIDFENSGTHLSTVGSFLLGESTITISVEPGGPRSQAIAAVYDTDTTGGPDPDLEWDGGTCSGCAGQGNVLMIADIGIASGGDSEDGGVIVLTGFPAGGYGFASLVAVDSDAKPFEILVDGGAVGSTTPGADGNVQGLSLDSNVISSEVRIDLDGDSGAVDDLEFCPSGD